MKMAVESMEMAPGAIPHPGKVPKQRLLSPELGFRMAAELRNFLWNSDWVFRVFASEGLNRRRGDARRCTRWAHHAQARPRLALAWVGVATSWCYSVSPSGSRGLLTF